LNLSVQKRYSRGLHFQANYTWSRFIDDVESRNELGGNPGSAFANFYDRRGDRGLSGNDIAHRFIWSSVYELPVGKGRLLELKGVWNQILGGWSTGLIAEFRTGPPWGVVEQTNRTNSFSQAVRPNVVGDPKLPSNRSRQESLERWFNITAFAQPADFTFGNGRPDIRLRSGRGHRRSFNPQGFWHRRVAAAAIPRRDIELHQHS
jgi:hypothetical protein